MSYVALYRKFRPDTFDEVKGQDHIVTTLKNQIKTGRIGHAYLFTGTRGTGKTTDAKILAKAVNCENPVDGNPCGKCPMCQSIAAGTSMNVIEMDAASNNGVDSIRQIIDEVAYPPTEGKYKVYIIVEVHMLSKPAFNALLKTLEEPPEYVIFILATTEVHAIPITILSRCQRYDFHRINIETIADRLRELMEREGIEVEEKAIRYIAKAADGSMRDALSLLDQCLAFYINEKLTYDGALKVLGAIDTEVFSKLLRYIIDDNVTGAITLLDEIVTEGRDLGQFVIDFTWYLRNLLLAKNSDDIAEVIEMSSDNFALLQEETSLVSDETLMRYIRVLSELSNDLRISSQKRVLIEIAIIKLCKPSMEKDDDSIISRIDSLERKMEKGIPMVAVTGVQQAQVASEPVEKVPFLGDASPEEVQQACKNWDAIRAKLAYPLKTYLEDLTRVTVSQAGEMLFVFDMPPGSKKVGGMFVEREESLQELNSLIDEIVKKHVKIKVEVNKTGVSAIEKYEDALAFFANKNVEVEEDEE